MSSLPTTMAVVFGAERIDDLLRVAREIWQRNGSGLCDRADTRCENSWSLRDLENAQPIRVTPFVTICET